MPTQAEMNLLVPRKLDELEQTHRVRILHAVESGSRAWGFASPDSDFDVRFLYVRPAADYLRLQPLRDVIETPVDDTWDVNGWDLNKTLRLLYRCNGPLYEWLSSPIVYRTSEIARRMRPLMQEYFSLERMLHHYCNTAVTTYQHDLDRELVRPKKYFYALRPILACRWVLDAHTPPPVLFSELAAACLPADLCGTVDHLLDLKMNGPETMTIPHLTDLDRYLLESIDEIKAIAAALPPESRSMESLERFFLDVLNGTIT